MALATRLTIEDYETLPDALARNHELLNGELVEVSGNTGRHNDLRDVLVRLLRAFIEEHAIGGKVLSEQEYDFGNDTTHAPDVSYFPAAKKSLYNPDRRVQLFVPELVIEIASPNDRLGALPEKIQRYLAAGVREAWLFWLDMRALFFFARGRRPEGVQEFRLAALPGLSLPIGDLFDRVG